MDNIQKFSDRELFSELFDNPINPLFLNMVPPFVGENSPMFHLQINGEAVLKWREVYGRPRTVFDLLQRSILPVGYELKASGQERRLFIVRCRFRAQTAHSERIVLFTT